MVSRVTDRSRIIQVKRLTGGISSSVHALTLEDQEGSCSHLVLRHWRDDPYGARAVALEEGHRRSRLLESMVGVPVIVTSAHSDADTRVKANELGCAAFFPKPFGAEELLLKLDSILSRETEQVES